MKRILQEHRTGCGVACVAMVAGTDYSNAMKVARQIFDWQDSQRTFYTSSAQLRELLRAFKVQTGRGRVARKWSSLPEFAIAGVNHNKETDTWHWVVFQRKVGRTYVLDPQPRTKTEVRTDFGRMSLRSCIPIGT